MYRKRFDNRRSNPNRADLYKDIEVRDASKPERNSTVNELISVKALSKLPKSGSSITVREDPYAVVLPGSDPYALVNRQATKLGGSYGGKDNLDGGQTQQLVTSATSNFLYSYDSIMARGKFNYRYLPILPTDIKRGKGFVREMLQSIDEILSIANSTTYTNLAIKQYYIATDLPINGESDITKAYPVGTPKGMYSMLITYQLVLQSIASVFNMFNKHKSNQGNMLRMSWNRETPKLNSLFGLYNKSSFTAQWKSMSLILRGEYFDADWMKQYNMLGSLTSRSSDAMTSPLLELALTHNMPKFRIFITMPAGEANSDGSINWSAGSTPAKPDLSTEDLDSYVQSSSNPQVQAAGTFSGLIDAFSLALSVNDTLYWARNERSAEDTDQAKLNFLSKGLDALIDISNVFKPFMGDLRTMLDVLQRVGVNQWVKNITLELVSDNNVPVTNNITVNDVFHALLTGGTSMTWNKDTFRWSGWTIWDKFFGIPEYDSKSGGAFLTFSLKDLVVAEDDASAQHATDYLPVAISGLFDATTDEGRTAAIYAVNRLGYSRAIKVEGMDPKSNKSTARLLPFSDSSIQIQVPVYSQTLNLTDEAFIRAAILDICGFVSDGEGDLAVEPSKLVLLNFEVEDITNEMITYARTKGPFVVNVAEKSNIGFLGLSSK